ncbi:hypothetical protein NMG60_11032722 [Bertholletia excelsa]
MDTMNSKRMLVLWAFALISSSWAGVGSADGDLLGQLLAVNGRGSAEISCMQKLIPCQPYLQQPTSPPSTCCEPLKEMIDGEASCLCDIFNNADLLKKFNATQDNALQLGKTCGASIDVSVCKKEEGASKSTATPQTPPVDSSSTNSTSEGSAGSRMVAYSCGLPLIFLVVDLIFAAI